MKSRNFLYGIASLIIFSACIIPFERLIKTKGEESGQEISIKDETQPILNFREDHHRTTNLTILLLALMGHCLLVK